MSKNYFLRTILLATILLLTNVNAWAQAKVFFEFKGTSGYLAPPATGWTSTGAEGGSYLKLSPGSITSPEYSKATQLIFKYDIASFGSGTTNQTKLSVLDANDNLIKEYTLTSTASSTYTTGQTLNIGEITSNFKIKIEGIGTGANNNSVRGVRLRNYSLVGNETSTTPSPSIDVTPSTLAFGNTDINATSPVQTVNVTASNLEAPLYYTITGTNASEFNAIGTLNNTGGSLSVSFTPTSVGGKEAILTITSDAIEKKINLSGTATAPSLIAPIANVTPPKNETGFTAEWNTVSGATEYILNVYTKNTNKNSKSKVVFSEDFDGFTAGATGAGAHTTDIGTSLDTYTINSGWIGSKVYQAGGSVKLGSSSALGYITTPPIDLSANDGKFTLSVEAMAWKGDATSINIYLNDALAHTIENLNNDESYILKPYSVSLTGGTSTSQIRFEGLQASKGRFFLENIEITQDAAGTTINHIEGSPFEGLTTTAHSITNLATDNTYYYTVIAKNANSMSAPSNEIAVELSSTTNINEDDQISNTKVWVSEGKIYVKASAGETIQIFSITGQVLDRRLAEEGVNTFNISAKGVILLKIGNKLAKVVL